MIENQQYIKCLNINVETFTIKWSKQPKPTKTPKPPTAKNPCDASEQGPPTKIPNPTKNLTTFITIFYTFMQQKPPKPGTRYIDFLPFFYFPIHIAFCKNEAKPKKNKEKSRTSRTRIDYQ